MPIVSQNIRVRHPEHFSVGEHSIVDDFCYFSTRVQIGEFSHIASGCSVAGGVARLFQLGSYCSLSSGVKVWCTSDDFVNDIVAIFPPWIEEAGPIKEHLITGDVSMADFTAVGANSVIMPLNRIPEGTVIGSLSFVPSNFDLEPWSVYAGTPVRFIKRRNKEGVMRQFSTIQERMARGRM